MPTPTRRWARRNPILAVFLALALWATMCAYAGDVQSCRRTVATRRAQTTNVGVLRAVLGQDVTRAKAYAAIDPSPAGTRINTEYASRRAVLLDRFTVPDVPSCFPIPGI